MQLIATPPLRPAPELVDRGLARASTKQPTTQATKPSQPLGQDKVAAQSKPSPSKYDQAVANQATSPAAPASQAPSPADFAAARAKLIAKNAEDRIAASFEVAAAHEGEMCGE